MLTRNLTEFIKTLQEYFDHLRSDSQLEVEYFEIFQKDRSDLIELVKKYKEAEKACEDLLKTSDLPTFRSVLNKLGFTVVLNGKHKKIRMF